MKMNYSYNEMKRAFECGRNFQLTGENNFQELIEELNQALPQADVSGRSELLIALHNIEKICDNQNTTHEQIWRIAHEAINSH
jgi:hypothetical protein